MEVERLTVGQLQTNCYLVWEKETHQGIIIDPGDDADYLLGRLNDLKVKPELILATHGHFDHLLAVLELKLAFKIPFLLHEKDLFLAKRAVPTAKFFSGEKEALKPLVDGFLKEGQIISFGKKERLKVVETPGHSPGGVIFESRGVVFSGDTLFKQGVGRTDYSYGSQTDLLNSIKNKLFKLPDKTVVYPGHGDETTIGKEKKNF
ncbi:MBL fold metallo-hydrolase [Candidatus Shapirobacteria bacterium]|nr:MBL fold metallo-hydrolase [Candidatus Shapirobacteria bacterium]